MSPVGAEKAAAKNSPLVKGIHEWLFPESFDGAAAVSEADVTRLSHDIDGVVALPGDPGYAEECATYNLAAPRRPAVVVAAASPGDVGRAVRFAGRRGLPAGVLATGHYLSARDTEPGGVRDAFGKDVHDRLAMVKRGYDPANLFRVNHNIPPIR